MTISRLFQILEMCDIHLERLRYAQNNLDEIFPLDETTYKLLSDSDKPFLDILNRLEKLELISDHKQWIMMREVRNQLSHEYPSETEEIIDGLNSLFNNVTTIGTVYLDLRTYLYSRFQE